jgi:hypothetical protein
VAKQSPLPRLRSMVSDRASGRKASIVSTDASTDARSPGITNSVGRLTSTEIDQKVKNTITRDWQPAEEMAAGGVFGRPGSTIQCNDQIS